MIRWSKSDILRIIAKGLKCTEPLFQKIKYIFLKALGNIVAFYKEGDNKRSIPQSN